MYRGSAKVVPLLKCGDKKQFSNYRPVSILPQFSKILEEVFYNRLISFIKINNIIYNGQYGFQENHSTSLALMEELEDITNNFDQNMVTTGVFIDHKIIALWYSWNSTLLVGKLSS